jgi:hypothetical protein
MSLTQHHQILHDECHVLHLPNCAVDACICSSTQAQATTMLSVGELR